jgi:hypothetical protein
MTTIIGVALTNRNETSLEFQKILTGHGCSIKTRIGLHPSENGSCTNHGIVLLEVEDGTQDLLAELQKHWQIQTMQF